MKFIPVDQAGLGSMVAIDVTPKVYDGAQTTNSDGTPFWVVQVLHAPLPTASGVKPKAQLEEIRIPLKQSPTFAPMTPVHFTNLVASHWEVSGRSGISLSATAVNAVPSKADHA
ncbi:hypothetical protein IWX64_001033 [Arthrobacter sp. CAN_A212]|uniref:hypothetical protein n=1 Tax=Arthrobacter sp. CAN_A212 TaxID=2787719 RepID=UPI0018C9B390